MPDFALANNIVEAGGTKVSDSDAGTDWGYTAGQGSTSPTTNYPGGFKLPSGFDPNNLTAEQVKQLQNNPSAPMVQTTPGGTFSIGGSWQPGLSGTPYFTPNQQPGTPGAGDQFEDLYRGLGITGQMSYSPSQQGTVGGIPGYPHTVDSSSHNAGHINAAAQRQFPGAIPQDTQDTFNKFMSWWNNNQPFQAGASMGPNRAMALGWPSGVPQLGVSDPAMTDYGKLYNQYNIPTPWVRNGTAYLPGFQNLGWNYSADLMRNNPGLFISTLQANQQQQSGARPANPSPWLPPQLIGGQNPPWVDQRSMLWHPPTAQGAAPGASPPTGGAPVGGAAPANPQPGGGGLGPLPPTQLPPGYPGGGGPGSQLPTGGSWGPSGFPPFYPGGGGPGSQFPIGGSWGGGSFPFPGTYDGGGMNSIAQLLNTIQGLQGGMGGFGSFPIRRPPLPAYNFGNLLYPAYGPMFGGGFGSFNSNPFTSGLGIGGGLGLF